MDWAPLKILIPPLLIGVPLWLGHRIGAWHKKKVTGADTAPIGPVVGATLGFFAFMLAFTFSMTASRFQSRKELFLSEVNAISNAYSKAGLLNEPYLSSCRKLLIDYVDVRVMMQSGKTSLKSAIERSQEILDSLWIAVETMAHKDPAEGSSFIGSVDNLRETFTKRVVIGVYYGIPPLIMYVLYFIAVSTMLLVGFQFGLSGKSSIVASVVLVISFSTGMWLIYALDNPEAGIIKVDQRPIIELQQQLGKRP